MDLMVVVRAIHIGASVLIAGAFAFHFLMGAGSRDDEWPTAVRPELGRWLRSSAAWGVSVALLSWLIWLALVAASMSASPLGSLNLDVLLTVLTQTSFGHAWTLRLALMVLLGLVLVWRARSNSHKPALGVADSIAAGSLLVSLAWAGHAVGTGGSSRPLHLTADALHLLGAGLWLGALLPLLFVLERARTQAEPAWATAAATATRRFSRLGIFAVLTLFATGLINAWLLVGSVPALMGSAYGRLVAVKLALFLTILLIAAINRLKLAPRLRTSDRRASELALFHLWRNVILEIGLGATIIAIVGLLGITPPSAHRHGWVIHQMDRLDSGNVAPRKSWTRVMKAPGRHAPALCSSCAVSRTAATAFVRPLPA